MAVDLAEHCSAEVINADSMQLYEGLPVLSAVPTIAERRAVPHHLFECSQPDDRWSVGRWVDHVVDLIGKIRKRGNVPVIAGGTGLYFEALTRGLAHIPDVSDTVQAEVSKIIAERGLDYLREELNRVDSEAARRIKGSDRQRLARAFSVYLQTGKPITFFHQNTSPVINPDEWKAAVLRPDRNQLYERIDRRFEQMLQRGVIDEVRGFLAKWGADISASHKAIGLAPLARYIAEEISMEQAVFEAKRDSRRYAKRQLTWSRGRAGNWPAFENGNDALDFMISKKKAI